MLVHIYCGGKGNTPPLMVEVQSYTITMEINITVPQKVGDQLKTGGMAQWQSSCPVYARPWVLILPYSQRRTKSTLLCLVMWNNGIATHTCFEAYNFEDYKGTIGKCIVKQLTVCFNVRWFHKAHLKRVLSRMGIPPNTICLFKF